MQEPPRKPDPAFAALARALSRLPRPRTSAKSDEPPEVLADRIKAMLLQQGATALAALTPTNTIQERAAVHAMAVNALKVNGFDGPPKPGPGDQPTLLFEFSEPAPDADVLALRAEPDSSGSEADAVSGVAPEDSGEEPDRSRGAA